MRDSFIKDAPHIFFFLKYECVQHVCALPQALCVSSEVSELGEYFLLPSERSLSE